MRRFAALVLLLATMGTVVRAEKPGPAAAIQLSAKLVGPLDALLEWKNAGGGAAGHVVEYINHPTDDWVILGFFPAGRNTFTHPRLAPQTPYAYRVRPFHGPASDAVEVTIAKGLSDQAYATAYAAPEDYSWAPPQTLATAGSGVLARKSIRHATSVAGAAPTDLKAEVIASTVSGFRLTWTDRSSDEEGFLLERVRSETDFTVCAMVERDINAFGWALEPPERKATFRVRAYHFGSASNIVQLTTGADPADESPRKTSAAADKSSG